MGRAPRILGDEIVYHVILRCNNKEKLFKSNYDFEMFVSILEHYRKKMNFEVHAYVLMHTHLHLILTTKESKK